MKPSFSPKIDFFSKKPIIEHEEEFDEYEEEEEIPEGTEQGIADGLVSSNAVYEQIKPAFSTNINDFVFKQDDPKEEVVPNTAENEDLGEIMVNKSAGFDFSSLIC